MRNRYSHYLVGFNSTVLCDFLTRDTSGFGDLTSVFRTPPKHTNISCDFGTNFVVGLLLVIVSLRVHFPPHCAPTGVCVGCASA